MFAYKLHTNISSLLSSVRTSVRVYNICKSSKLHLMANLWLVEICKCTLKFV